MSDLCTALKNILKQSKWSELVITEGEWRGLVGEVRMLGFGPELGAIEEVTHPLRGSVSPSVKYKLQFGAVVFPQGNEYKRGVIVAQV